VLVVTARHIFAASVGDSEALLICEAAPGEVPTPPPEAAGGLPTWHPHQSAPEADWKAAGIAHPAAVSAP
jgi:hypothetical protein